MAKDIQGIGLGLASRFAGSELAQKTGLRKPVEKLAYLGTRAGFRLAGSFIKRKERPTDSSPGERLPNSREKNLFDLTLTEEQLMIRDSVQAFARDVVRPLAHDADELKNLPDGYLQQTMELGLNLFAVPESLGGAAQSYSPTTSALIAEDLAWGDFSLALSAQAPVAVANAIVRWGTRAQQEKWLPLWLSETPVLAAIAVQESGALFRPRDLATTAKSSRQGFVLKGEKTLVPLAGNASLYLVAALYDGKPRLFLVPADAKGVSFTASQAMGLKAAATGTLQLDAVQLPADALLGDEKGDFDYQAFIDLGQLHWCALAVGTCQAALDYLIPYCNERIAFGEPISHRQSVAFMLADMATEIEGMRLMLWRAAARAEQGMSFHREAMLAHLLCAEKAMKIGTDAVQLLGGHGFTKEHPAERWYRDLRVLSCISGGLHL
ncbi:acyl-CoA dehydrogenase family protein [Thalassolituus sp. LLYu03]|uniref:acyl-CoA dehydrogenase family protein n=1 Tax=Thalassolituus sp. LLYu03 TaxID=3421656 RepID=UPI003D2B98B4